MKSLSSLQTKSAQMNLFLPATFVTLTLFLLQKCTEMENYILAQIFRKKKHVICGLEE